MERIATRSKFTALRLVLFSLLMQLPIESAKAEVEMNMPIRSIKSHVTTTIGPLVGIAVGLAVILLVSTLSILNSSTSSGLVTAANTISAFMAVIGLGIVVKVISTLF